MAFRQVIEPAEVAVARQRMVFNTLCLLRPFDLPAERKVRLGAPGDGSYVLVDCLRPTQPIMSFGVGPSLNFELTMAERGHDVLMFDHTVDSLPSEHPRFQWFREGIAGTSDPDRAMFTLAEHCKRLPAGTDAPILKMDVEGSEWSVLANVSTDLLARFEQITMELHGLEFLGEPAHNAVIQKALGQLAGFTLCHVHANNFESVVVVEGLPVLKGLEVTYIRSDLVQRVPSKTFYPTDIDHPNYHYWPDVPLWFFPFAPGSENIVYPDESNAEAVARYRKAADAGALAAMHNIAVHCQNGIGVAQNYADAMRWYRKAADLGWANAMTGIGFLYDKGMGVASDHGEAVRWWRKAAALGDETAKNNLAVYGEVW